MRGQAGYGRGLKGILTRLQTVEAAKGSVDEGEAVVARLEEQGVVVAADATVEGGEPLRRELGANARFVIDLSVRLAMLAAHGGERH